MQFQVTLSNPVHPEYGVVTIPFPLPREEYDHSIEMLEVLEIGDAISQDCKIEEIIGSYPVLKRLEGQFVNVDELDYLAKRLDSFTAGCEDKQFQAMVEKLSLTEIRDFINLTFCCQQATVITDFSNLEQIGKDHYMTLNGGFASMEELDNLNGEETARLLIDSGTGVITPYGVVYGNGMRLEPLYRGGPFPPYLHDTHPLELDITLLCGLNNIVKKATFYLPMTGKQYERTLARIGIMDEIWVNFSVNSIHMRALGDIPDLNHKGIEDLNEMSKAIASLQHSDLLKLRAAITLAQPQSASQVKHLAENLDLFEFVPDIKTPAEYGQYMIQESGHFDYDDNLDGFYDFEGYAKQRMSQERGQFVEGGYISYQGSQSLDEVMADFPTLDEDFQMGWMQ